MKTSSNTVLLNGDMSQATLSSLLGTNNAGNISQALGYSVQAVWTGSPVGTIKLQASNDSLTWDDVANSSQAVSGAGSFMWNVNGAFFPFLQIVYTKTSGTGSLNVNLTYKGF